MSLIPDDLLIGSGVPAPMKGTPAQKAAWIDGMVSATEQSIAAVLLEAAFSPTPPTAAQRQEAAERTQFLLNGVRRMAAYTLESK